MVTICQVQDEISEKFALLNGNVEMIILYIIRLGRSIPPMAATDKTDQHLIKGCQSKVWLSATKLNGKIYFSADSNTAITKGLISLLMMVLNEQSPEAILAADLYFMQKNGIDRFIGTRHSNGLAAIFSHMKALAANCK